jgi:hypothetical protein
MGKADRHGTGSHPGIESQQTAAALGKPSQVPRDPDGPNPEPYDRSPDTEALRPGIDEGAGDPREEALDARRETEEAALTGRFPDDGEIVDRSNPIEPEEREHAAEPRH